MYGTGIHHDVVGLSKAYAVGACLTVLGFFNAFSSYIVCYVGYVSMEGFPL